MDFLTLFYIWVGFGLTGSFIACAHDWYVGEDVDFYSFLFLIVCSVFLGPILFLILVFMTLNALFVLGQLNFIFIPSRKKKVDRETKIS
jgi:hypothetical protein